VTEFRLWAINRRKDGDILGSVKKVTLVCKDNYRTK